MKIAIFDLDQTLIKEKSLIVFLDTYFEQFSTISGRGRNEVFTIIREMFQENIAREQINRFYYSLFKDIHTEIIDKLAKKLSANNRINFFPYLYHEVQKRKLEGFKIVISTGASLGIVKYILRKINPYFVLATIPEIINNRMTGNLKFQNIGKNKYLSLRSWLTMRNTEPYIVNYYDDPSDKYLCKLANENFLVDCRGIPRRV